MIHSQEPIDACIDVHENIVYQPPPDHCIFRVQNDLRRVNKEAYEPNIIAIGPYHSGTHHYLQYMEEHKKRYLNNLLYRNKQEKKAYVDAIKLLEPEVRKCYADPPNKYNADQLVNMMVLDGCFIIELLRKYGDPRLRDEHDPIFRSESIFASLQRDLLLFENQIPFFVILVLFDMTKGLGSEETFTSLARKFLISIFPGNAREDIDNSDNSKRFKHLLALVHSSWLPLYTPPKTTINEDIQIRCVKGFSESDEDADWSQRYMHIPCAEDLKESGIKFVRGCGNVFDVRYHNGTIIIPPLIVEDRTESFFRNLIGYEQTRQGTDRHFVTDYVQLLNCLIDSSGDVGTLRRRKIINNRLGNDEVVSSMFNKMSDSVVQSVEFFHYKDVFNQVNMYRNKPQHRWMATLRRKYLNNPWAIISIVAAIVLLLLTFLQTVFTIKSSV